MTTVMDTVLHLFQISAWLKFVRFPKCVYGTLLRQNAKCRILLLLLLYPQHPWNQSLMWNNFVHAIQIECHSQYYERQFVFETKTFTNELVYKRSGGFFASLSGSCVVSEQQQKKQKTRSCSKHSSKRQKLPFEKVSLIGIVYGRTIYHYYPAFIFIEWPCIWRVGKWWAKLWMWMEFKVC